MKLLMLCRFGSHLYGTNTPTSDLDFKGIFLPSVAQVLLGNIPRTIRMDKKVSSDLKNTSDDMDVELYSIHKFMSLLKAGETGALDMIHVNQENLLYSTWDWKNIQNSRAEAYSRNMKAFIGYAQQQAAKYGLKGSRLAEAKEVLSVLSQSGGGERMHTLWDKLPKGKHCYPVEPNPQGVKQYLMGGKILQSTVTVDYATSIVQLFVDNYGERARKAERNEGVDFKALSHAMRAALQMQDIFSSGDLRFPLPYAEYLKDIKDGKIKALEVISDLEAQIGVAKEMAEESEYPEKINEHFWDNMLFWCMKSHINDLSDRHKSEEELKKQVEGLIGEAKEQGVPGM